MKRIAINDPTRMRRAVSRLTNFSKIALDTETTGVEYYDRIFAVVLCTPEYSFYFNFNDLTDEYLDKDSFKLFDPIFSNPNIKWFIHNAVFDAAMLLKEGIILAGRMYCTMTLERIIQNNRMN